MSLDLVVSSLLWGKDSTRYQRYPQRLPSLWSQPNSVGRSSHKLGNLSFSWFALKMKEDCGHIYDLFIESHYIVEVGGQSCGRIQGHIHLTYRGTSALPSQAFNWLDPRRTLSKWASIQVLAPRKWGNQMPDSRITPKRTHPSKLFSLWKSNHARAKERWDMETLYRLQIP